MRSYNPMSVQMPSNLPPPAEIRIRKASGEDASSIRLVLEHIVNEGIHSAIAEPWPVEQQRAYIEAFSPREVLHVAELESGQVIGFQSLDLWSPVLTSMAHVGQIGTFLLKDWRGRGIGKQLFHATKAFAVSAGYVKFVIHVRAANDSAQAFYRRLGFVECGRLKRQVRVHGQDDDEVLLEFFL